MIFILIRKCKIFCSHSHSRLDLDAVGVWVGFPLGDLIALKSMSQSHKDIKILVVEREFPVYNNAIGGSM